MNQLEPAVAWGLVALATLVVFGFIYWLVRPDSSAPQPVQDAAIRARNPRGTKPLPAKLQVLTLTNEEHHTLLCESITVGCLRVQDVKELVSVAALHKPAAVFVDIERLPELEGELAGILLVLVIDAAPTDTRRMIVDILGAHPLIGHVVVGPMLGTPLGRTHLKSLVERLVSGSEHDLLDTASVGRVAMIAQASRRDARFGRMQDYFTKQGFSSRTISAIYEVAEELVMNALYNAPTEAGYFKAPVSRTEDVTLPIDRACEISYGIEGSHAFVRLRDTFGALRRERLFEVLNRCSKTGVSLDESRGGAGLGIWRVFSAATTIAITVIPGRLTDILIRMVPKQGKLSRQLVAVDLYFLPDSDTTPEELVGDHDSSSFDHSITMIQN